MAVAAKPLKIDVEPRWWDNVFAPSSCLVLITTVDRQGRVNAAAFGTCTRVCHEPMYIAFTCSADKDTTNNALATGEFVVNVVPFEQAVLDKVPVCGLPFKPGVNELEKAGLTAIPARVLRPFRMQGRMDAAVALSRDDLRQGRGGQHRRRLPRRRRLHRLGQAEAGALLRHALSRPLRPRLRQAHARGLALRRPRRGIPRRRKLARRLPQRRLSAGHTRVRGTANSQCKT